MRLIKKGRKICILMSFPQEGALVKLTEQHLLLNLEKQITGKTKGNGDHLVPGEKPNCFIKEELSHACFLNPAKYLLSGVIDRLFS